MKPRAAGDEHVDAAVVVVVGLKDVQPAHQSLQSRLPRSAGEVAVSVVVKVLQLDH
jgi:hypothetical protein